MSGPLPTGPAPLPPTDTTAFEDLSGAPALVATWGALADRLHTSPFLHPGFVLAWWASFGAGQLVLATARRNGELVAALPLVQRHGALRSPANWHTPRTGMLAQDEAAATALATALFATHRRHVALSFLDEDETGTQALRRAADEAGCREHTRAVIHSPYLALEGSSWETFEAGMGASTRASLRRRRRKLEALGAVTVEMSDGSTDLDARLAEVIGVEGMGWKGEQGTAIASRPETLRFYRAVAAWAAERGWLRLHLLRLDGAPIAVALGLEAQGTHASMKIGYDPAYRQFGPGVMLQGELVRQAFANGMRRFELLGDADEHKRAWSSGTRELVALDAWAPTLVGSANRLATRYGRPLARRMHLGGTVPLTTATTIIDAVAA